MATIAKTMNKMKVVQLLKLLPEIDEEISTRKNIMTELEQHYNTVAAIQYDGMPKGKNHVSRPTEKMALNIPNYVRGEVKHYENEIEEFQQVKVEILKEVSRLKLKHKKVIFGFYFHGLTWKEVAKLMNYSSRQCKNIRDEALEQLLQRFSENRVLVEYRIKE